MAEWYNTIKNMSMSNLLIQVGADLRSKRYTCPICHAERASKNDKRPPLAVINGDKYFVCNSCKAQGNGFDLIAHIAMGKPAAECDKTGWDSIRQFVKQHLDKDMGPDQPQMYRPRQIEKPEYPPQEEVQKLLEQIILLKHLDKDLFFHRNTFENIKRWLKHRCIDPECAPAAWLNPKAKTEWMSKVEASSGKMTAWWPDQWIQDYPLVMPLYDYKGQPRSILGRSYKSKVKRKTTVPISYSTSNLFLANKLARNFMQKNTTPSTIWIVEGEIDFITASQANIPCIGIRSGSIDGLAMLPWSNKQKVIIATDNDEAGDRYASDIKLLINPAQPYRINLNAEN